MGIFGKKKVCPNCGKKVDEDAVACPKCGKKFGGAGGVLEVVGSVIGGFLEGFAAAGGFDNDDD